MTYVTDQTSAELCAHMRKLKAMPGWHEPLADRLWKEVQDLTLERDALRAALQDKAVEARGEPVNLVFIGHYEAQLMTDAEISAHRSTSSIPVTIKACLPAFPAYAKWRRHKPDWRGQHNWEGAEVESVLPLLVNKWNHPSDIDEQYQIEFLYAAQPAPVVPDDVALRSRVQDLLHLLSFAKIETPTPNDKPEAEKAMADIRAMIAASQRKGGQ